MLYTLSNNNKPHSDQKLNYLAGTPVTLFSITARHTVTKAELFSWESCYTLLNYSTPHSDQSWTI